MISWFVKDISQFNIICVNLFICSQEATRKLLSKLCEALSQLAVLNSFMCRHQCAGKNSNNLPPVTLQAYAAGLRCWRQKFLSQLMKLEERIKDQGESSLFTEMHKQLNLKIKVIPWDLKFIFKKCQFYWESNIITYKTIFYECYFYYDLNSTGTELWGFLSWIFLNYNNPLISTCKSPLWLYHYRLNMHSVVARCRTATLVADFSHNTLCALQGPGQVITQFC